MNELNWKTVEYQERDWLIARLAALATLIHLLEAAFPSPIPGIKPGLANVITLIAFFYFGLGVAVWVSLLRVLAGSLLIGTFLSPAFALSLAGASSALLSLALLSLMGTRWRPGPVGMAVAASLMHMLGQFGLAYTLLIPHKGLFNLLPLLLIAALLSGIVSGVIAHKVLNNLRVKQ